MHSKRFKPNSPNSEETDEDASERERARVDRPRRFASKTFFFLPPESSDKAQAGGDATKYSDFARRQMVDLRREREEE